MAAEVTFKKRSRKNIRGRRNLESEEDVGGGESVEQNVVQAGSTQQKKANSTTTTKPTSRGVLSFEDELEDDESSEVFQIKKSARSQHLAKEQEKEKKRREEKEKRRAEREAKLANAGRDDSDEEGEGVTLGERLSAGYLPDATTIHAIRKQREKARKLGVDYIPLDSSNSYERSSTVRGSSRLIREDEHDKSDEDEEEDALGTMTFGSRKEPGKQMQVLTALENVASESEDDETRCWEEEQINKGMKAQLGEPSQHQHEVTDNPYYQTAAFPLTGSYATPPGMVPPGPYDQHIEPFAPPKPTHRPAPSSKLPVKLIPITMETLISKLKRQLTELREDEERKERRLRQVEEDLDAAEDTIDMIERKGPLLEREYHFFQQTKGYFRDLLSCLGEKAPTITQLGQRVIEVHQEKSALLTERRRQDMKDEAEECTTTNGSVKAGPDKDIRQRRAVEREARRRRRREKREREEVLGHYDGQSSDDEILETNRLKFAEDLQKVLVEAEAVFSDVLEEFCDIASIKQRLEEWKFGYSHSYEHAFISLWLPSLFAPFVSYQLLKWNPLEDNCPDIETMSWYDILMFYGFREGEDPATDDKDLLLVPKLVDKVVIPRLTEFVERVWDPLSMKQGSRLIKMIKSLQEEYPTVNLEGENTQALLAAVVRQFREVISNEVYIPLMTRSQLEGTLSTPKIIFYHRQFWTTVKLLSNITCWEGLLPSASIQQLSVDGLVNRYLLLSLQNCPIDNYTVEKTKYVVACLPQSWFTPPIEHTLTKSLQSLRRYLTHLAQSLPTYSRQQLIDVLQMMVTVGSHETAITIATEHNLTLTPPIR